MANIKAEIKIEINKEEIMKEIEGLKKVVDNYKSLFNLMKIVRVNGVVGLEKQIDHELSKADLV